MMRPPSWRTDRIRCGLWPEFFDPRLVHKDASNSSLPATYPPPPPPPPSPPPPPPSPHDDAPLSLHAVVPWAEPASPLQKPPASECESPARTRRGADPDVRCLIM